MGETIYKESYRKLLESMANISTEMPEIILLDYFDKFGNYYKYLFSLFNESYKSILMTCESLSKACVSQAAVLLRLLLESASIIHVLVQNPDLLEEYIKHFKIRLEIGLNPDEESNLLEKYFPDIEKNQRLKYMDYGWFKSKMQPVIRKGKVIEPSETDLIRLAGFDEIISWKKLYLDKLSHQSYTMLNMIDKNGDIPIVINFIQILCKLFDHVCCDFHAITGFEFIFDGISKFQSEFREIYKKEILK